MSRWATLARRAAEGPPSRGVVGEGPNACSDADAPKLAAGKVVTVTGAQLTPDRGLALQVTLDMTFEGTRWRGVTAPTNAS